MHHGTGHTHHGGPSVLDFDIEGAITLDGVGDLGLARVSSGDASGTSFVTSRKVLWSTSVLERGGGVKFDNSSEEEDLGKAKRGNVGQGGEAHAIIQDIGNWVFSLQVERSGGEGDSGFLEDHTNESSHGNTSVLDFDSTTTGEAFGIVDKTKRIEKSKRRKDTKTIRGFGGVQGGSRAGLLSTEQELDRKSANRKAVRMNVTDDNGEILILDGGSSHRSRIPNFRAKVALPRLVERRGQLFSPCWERMRSQTRRQGRGW
mmetsp:Transcript_5828/g.12278  ORF Transcript_5828/g.12278 Transcript_5828/m.12278 type:complete len:260 (-) Transcript_5828:78-857(-)